MAHQKNDWKDKLAMVYSTNPDYQPEDDNEEQESLPNQQQDLRVWIDRKGRKGKTATLVKGFVGTDGELKTLATSLKSQCGVGGSVKEGEIVIQGAQQAKVLQLLLDWGYRAKAAGG